jgi:uncharacterized protein (TIGR03118 family)
MKATIVRNGFTSTRRLGALALVWAVLPVLGVMAGGNSGHGGNKEVRLQQTNLVSDVAGVAQLQDTNLVNAWGVSFNPTGPFWVSDNGTGLATLYTVTNDAAGLVRVVKNPLEVAIPGAGNPTGQLFNGTPAFHTNLFIFASEDGTISGWRPALGTAAETLTNRSTAVYKGITLTTNSHGPVLLAANFSEGTIDMYDGNINLLGQFADTAAPAGFAPFNVQIREGLVFVTFAKQDAAKHDDVAGPGNGLIDVFNPTNGVFTRFATGSNAGGKLQAINSPWGVAIAPSGFGGGGDRLLVGNFGDGTLMSFDAKGQFLGLLNGADGQPLVIDGLWALTFGNGGQAGTPDALFFSSGPNEENHGLFGRLQPVTH